MEHFLSLVLHL